MYADDLIEILRKLPPDTNICKTSGEDGCEGLNSAKYFPQYNILYLEPYWGRKSKGYIDMGYRDSVFFGQESCCPYSKEELWEIRNLAKKGKEIVDAKKDGKMHRIQVEGFEKPHRDFTLWVDEKYIEGAKCSPARARCFYVDFEWESLGDGAKSEKP